MKRRVPPGQSTVYYCPDHFGLIRNTHYCVMSSQSGFDRPRGKLVANLALTKSEALKFCERNNATLPQTEDQVERFMRSRFAFHNTDEEMKLRNEPISFWFGANYNGLNRNISD